MDGSIVLGGSQRKRLLAVYRGKEANVPAEARLRAHIILLLSAGRPWAEVADVLFCSTATIARWKERFEAGGVEALLEQNRGRKSVLLGWAAVLVAWVLTRTPRDFGYCRSRWCCATLAVVLWDVHRVRVCDETVRRWLARQNVVWRRPRPVPGPTDPQRAWKLRKIRELLRDLPPDEAAVFADEVDLNLNPEIGCMWMLKGEQAEVVTPGTNVKRYLAGSMSWRTGELVVTQGDKRDAELFVRHLDELRHRFRRYRVIHVICDNARFHTAKGSKVVRAYLAAHGERVVLHYLPAYAPQTNPIERVWWHLREQVTRNHRCQCIEELVDLTMAWLDEHGAFKIEGSMYQRLKQAAT
jgi:putative transposase